MLLLAEHGIDGEVYHVANGKTRELREYIEILYREVAPEIKPRLGEIPYGSNQIMFLGADITKLKETTGFEPQTMFEDGIRRIKEEIEYEDKLSRL